MALREWTTNHLIEKSTMRSETAALVAAFTGKARRCPKGPRYHEPRKGKVILGDATEGRAALNYGTARRAGCHYHHSMVSTLIKAG